MTTMERVVGCGDISCRKYVTKDGLIMFGSGRLVNERWEEPCGKCTFEFGTGLYPHQLALMKEVRMLMYTTCDWNQAMNRAVNRPQHNALSA